MIHLSKIFAVAATAIAGVVTAYPSDNLAHPAASGHKAVLAAQALAESRSPTSNVKGKVFDRFITIWFENTDFDTAQADPNFQKYAQKGILLDNYFGLTHPSEPNYMASFGGDYFGLDGDPFIDLPVNVSSLIDLLEDKKISWGLYQEDMPYTGFQGMVWPNQITGADAYVRKHNPAIVYNSTIEKPDRLHLIKNTTYLADDIKNHRLPQYSFITPNMTSDGHDSSVTVAGKWLDDNLGPLLKDPYVMKNTLILVTFDENEIYTTQNRVFSFLVGDAVPEKLVNTTDSNYYDHYSQLATLEANWNLHTLGRFDVGANVFEFVADKTGDEVRSWPDGELQNRYFNYSYPGILAAAVGWAPQPVPNTKLVVNKRTVLPEIKKYWEGKDNGTVYQGQLTIPDGYHY